MLWFLRLFPAFRALQSEVEALRETLQTETTTKLLLQDRLDSAISERQKLWDMTRECISGERVAYQSQVNAQWQRQGFGAPYPDAPKLPPHAIPPTEPPESAPRPEFPSQRAARATQDFLNEYMAQKKFSAQGA